MPHPPGTDEGFEFFDAVGGRGEQRRLARELRADAEADLATGFRTPRLLLADVVDVRRLLEEVREEATEAKQLAQPCHELVSALERLEPPKSLQTVLGREAAVAAKVEAEKIQQLQQGYLQRLESSLHAALRRQEEQLQLAMNAERGRLLGEVDARLRQHEKVLKEISEHVQDRPDAPEETSGSSAVEESRLQETLTDLMEKAFAHACVPLSQQLQELNKAIEWCVERSDHAWREEAELRALGDADIRRWAEELHFSALHTADAVANFESATRRRESESQSWPFDPPGCPRDMQALGDAPRLALRGPSIDGESERSRGSQSDEELEAQMLGLLRDVRGMCDMRRGLRMVITEVFTLLHERRVPIQPFGTRQQKGARRRALEDVPAAD